MAKDIVKSAQAFGHQLEAVLGDDLVAFMLYGPAVRGDGPDEATTLLVLRDASPDQLRPIGNVIAEWSKKGNPPPLIFSEEGWRASTDVFPIEMEEMREAHLLVKGEDPLEGLTTTKADLRRQLEREVRGKLLRLRTEFAAAAPNGKALGALLVESARTFFVLFRAALRLTGAQPPARPADLVEAIAGVAGLESRAFDWVLAKLGGEKVPALQANDPVGDGYVEQIERLARFVDAYDVAPGTTPE